MDTAHADFCRAAVGSKPRLVLVDDDADMREVLELALARYGAAVEGYGDARHALSVLETGAVDALVTDLMLSPCDGVWLVKRIRAMPRLARLPIIVLTGHSDAASVAAAWHAGVDDILIKPVPSRAIYDRVARRITGA